MSERQSYKVLGGKLKAKRLQRHESLDEVSGAVEIETPKLEDIEAGLARPDEDILVLLISHFEIEGKDAEQLWELAGYAQGDTYTEVSVPSDNRIFYTDLVHITTNKSGVVINFLQQDSNNKASVVSRVGMSKEHAAAVLDLLHRALHTAGEGQKRLLPPPGDS